MTKKDKKQSSSSGLPPDLQSRYDVLLQHATRRPVGPTFVPAPINVLRLKNKQLTVPDARSILERLHEQGAIKGGEPWDSIELHREKTANAQANEGRQGCWVPLKKTAPRGYRPKTETANASKQTPAPAAVARIAAKPKPVTPPAIQPVATHPTPKPVPKIMVKPLAKERATVPQGTLAIPPFTLPATAPATPPTRMVEEPPTPAPQPILESKKNSEIVSDDSVGEVPRKKIARRIRRENPNRRRKPKMGSMTVGKFLSILERKIAAIKKFSLGDLPAREVIRMASRTKRVSLDDLCELIKKYERTG